MSSKYWNTWSKEEEKVRSSILPKIHHDKKNYDDNAKIISKKNDTVINNESENDDDYLIRRRRKKKCDLYTTTWLEKTKGAGGIIIDNVDSDNNKFSDVRLMNGKSNNSFMKQVKRFNEKSGCHDADNDDNDDDDDDDGDTNSINNNKIQQNDYNNEFLLSYNIGNCETRQDYHLVNKNYKKKNKINDIDIELSRKKSVSPVGFDDKKFDRATRRDIKNQQFKYQDVQDVHDDTDDDDDGAKCLQKNQQLL
ncbi:protein PFC0760c-like [Aphidius gifuensis]|uniref:protein PFC0760c-like n=1 Tax=Aphidius gifuensis TaxID=684658 RepID=UPI001CDC47AB|nr:protein PFC0760c-like [Aphidius gifuensis]